jgi:hypothetical protein
MVNEDTIRQLEENKMQLLERVKQIDITIETLKAMSSFNQPSGATYQNGSAPLLNVIGRYAEYDPKANMKTKLALVLKKENRFLNIRQIADILNRHEPKIEAKDFITKLYPAVADLKKNNTIIKFTVGESNINSFWGSKNWLNEDGSIKDEHKYDEGAVVIFGNTDIEI